MDRTKEERLAALEALKKAEAKQGQGICPVCNKKFGPPVQRGRNSQFCGLECRRKHRKVWRRRYDAQDHVKETKRKREKERRRREKQLREHVVRLED